MKKIMLFVIIAISILTLTACTHDENYKLAATYDSEARKCNVTNISEKTNYEKLKVTIVINGKNGFSRELSCDIGTLNQGETYNVDLSYISEDIEIYNAYIKSYEYYQDEFFFILGIVVVAILLIAAFMDKFFE